MFEKLNEDNFTLFAMKSYTNPHCTDLLEFNDDLKRIRYVKRLFKKYEQSGDLKERLIFNHLMVFYNSFEPQCATRMLCFRLDNYLQYLKPFLLYMGYWTEKVVEMDGRKITDSDIIIDQCIVDTLRNIHVE